MPIIGLITFHALIDLPGHMAVYEDFHALLWRNDS